MAAREFYDAVDKRTQNGMRRALLGAALIEPDLFHMCVSFCAWSLRGAYEYGNFHHEAVILEGRTDKIQLVDYLYRHGFCPRQSIWMYTVSYNRVDKFDAKLVQCRGNGSAIVKLNIESSHADIWRLLMDN